ncbi:hypothetical protein [Kitasatospora sp. NPDC058046]|uniref:hypothetical protein n=1 Tax=Kitasatospora sp. NPDC058046 TaxID=3346312 RepID=UPI0036DB6DAC
MLRRTLPALAVALLLCAPTSGAWARSPGRQVAVVDQASRSVLVLQSAEELMAYRGPGRLPVVWGWSADRAPELTDLAPVLADPGRFWVATLTGLWRFDPATDRFTAVHLADPAAERDLKSVGDEPGTGRLLTAAPEHEAPCDWCTSVITLHRPEGTRSLRGSRLYKARWWSVW